MKATSEGKDTGIGETVEPGRSAQQSEGAAVPHWYAAYTAARHEKRVAEQLEKRRVEHYLPLYETIHKWKDRRVRVQLPLFPGYVFVRIPVEQRRRVLEIPGVAWFVGIHGSPTPLPERDIETLRSGLATRSAQPHPYLTIGRRVLIKSGPFQGMEGILKRKKDNFRVVISLDLIQRSILLDIEGAEVEPVNSSSTRNTSLKTKGRAAGT